MAVASAVLPAMAMAEDRPHLSFYGMPGLIDMPTADTMPDADFAVSMAYFGGNLRNTLAFQITPRLTGSFRYSWMEGFFTTPVAGDLYDRSFDLAYRLVDEGDWMPALTVGLRDFGGTGIYSSEYLVATKHLGGQFAVTGGIGWGRLGTYNGFSNPLSVFGDRFDTRPDDIETGQVNAGQWFRGDAAFFGGIEWRPTEKWVLMAEYSSDAYPRETASEMFERKSPLNFGASYQAGRDWSVGGYYLYGSEIGLKATLVLNPKNPPTGGSRASAPIPVAVRPGVAASWGQEWTASPQTTEALREATGKVIAADGMAMESLTFEGRRATLRLRNSRFPSSAQAVGRVARIMTQTMPPSVETFVIVPVVEGMPTSAVTLKRSDIERFENAAQGTALSYQAAGISGAVPQAAPGDFAPGLYPDFSWSLAPYLRTSFFDPDAPIRGDVGLELSARYDLAPGLVISGAIQKRVIGNLADSDRPSDSVLPHVRSDFALYDKQGDPGLSRLTADYFFRPGDDLFGRVSAGYLERMYGGLSAEVLWKPADSRLALGAEVNYARQRDFDMMFGFQDYDVVTGHASAYYDIGNGFHGQLDVGRYLAGDWGATFALDREFANGWKVGGFFTLTDVSFDEFGEGSFDKGIRLEIPVSWFSGQPTRRKVSTVIRPLSRDGGARLDVENRLYGLVREYQDPALGDQWGQFWR